MKTEATAPQPEPIHVFFFPFMTHGHTIPVIDMVKLFASRGVKTTIITTPVNVPLFSKTIQRAKDLGSQIDIKTLKFPTTEVGLPERCENMDSIPHGIANLEMVMNFFKATTMLQEQLEFLLQECKPDCLVSDMFLPWTAYAASKFGIPRLVFHGTSLFTFVITECITRYEPHKKVSSGSEPFVVPNLPGDITLTRNQLPDSMSLDVETPFHKIVKQVDEAELKSCGAVVNSFYELESAYADYYRNVMGKKAWYVGPLSLCNTDFEDKALRGKQASVDEHECLKWLDSKKRSSVVYVCFGSTVNLSSIQLMEIANGLEASGQQFIWVVKKHKNGEEEKEDRLPESFERRMQGKGLIIRGWAPQVMILDHEAIGGFVTHCGWNSTLEGITAGVPMVTWPVFAEQFYNEKLVTQVLKIGVSVGVDKWSSGLPEYCVNKEAIEKAVKEMMVGDKAVEMRSRAEALAEMARKAVEKGGSSYSDFDALIQELSLRRN